MQISCPLPFQKLFGKQSKWTGRGKRYKLAILKYTNLNKLHASSHSLCMTRITLQSLLKPAIVLVFSYFLLLIFLMRRHFLSWYVIKARCFCNSARRSLAWTQEGMGKPRQVRHKSKHKLDGHNLNVAQDRELLPKKIRYSYHLCPPPLCTYWVGGTYFGSFCVTFVSNAHSKVPDIDTIC